MILVDRLASLRDAAFSSAALPLADFRRLNLPAEVIGSRWSCWQLLGPAQHWRSWSSPRCLGLVLDFASLLQWLADQVE